MSTAKRKWTIFALIAMLVCSVFGVFGISVTPAHAEEATWSGSTFTQTQEDGQTVWTAANDGGAALQQLNYSGTVGNNNTFTFQYRPNDFAAGDTANVAFHVVCANGNRLTYQFLNYWNCWRISYNDVTQAEGNYPPNTTDGWSEMDVWFTFKCVFIENYAQIYVDGNLMVTLPNTQKAIFNENATCYFTVWGCNSSVKGMTFSNTEVPVNSWAGSYTPATEGEEAVYTNTDMYSLSAFYHAGEIGDYDTFSFDYRPNGNCAGDTANIQFVIVDINGNQLQYQFRNFYKYYVLLYNDYPIAEGNYATNTGAWDCTDQWFHFECVFFDGSLQIYVDGELKTTYTETGGILLDKNLTCFMTSWGQTPSIKNLTFSKTNVEPEEPEIPDEPEIEYPTDWTGETYTITVENEEFVYTAAQDNGAAVQYLNYVGTVGNNNTFTFQYRPNAGGISDTSNVSFHVQDTSGNRITFQFLNYWNCWRINYNDATQAEGNYPPNTTDGWSETDVWFTFKCVLVNNNVEVWVDGELMHTLKNTQGANFDENATCFFTIWGCDSSIKNMAFSYTEIVVEPEEPEIPVEPEVSDPNWTSETYTVAKEGEKLVWTGAQNDDLQSLTYAKDDANSYNTMSFSFRPNEYYGGYDMANVSYNIVVGNTTVAITFMNHWKLMRVIKYVDGVETAWLAEARFIPEENFTAGWNGYDVWYDVEVVYTNDVIIVTVNGTELGRALNHGIDFSNAAIHFSSWACAPSITDIAFSNTEVVVEVPDWLSNTYTEADGVYTAKEETTGSAQVLTYTKDDANSYNTMSFSFKPNAYYGGFDTASVAYNITVGDTVIAVTFMNHWKLLRVIKYVGGAEVAWLTEARYESEDTYEAGWNKYSDWYDVEIIYTNDIILVNVNGKQVGIVVGHGIDFSNAAIHFSSWACAPSITDITLSAAQVNVNDYLWAGSTFEKSQEDGATVYTSTGALDSLQHLTYAHRTGSDNAISYDVKFIEEGLTEHERNLSFHVFSSSKTGVTATFQLLPHWNAARIQIFEANGSGRIVGVGNYVPTEWLNVTCIFEANYLMMYVNGELIALSFDSLWNDFNDTNCNFSVWGTSASVKGMIFSTEEKDLTELWKGTNYTPSEVDGEIVYTATHTGGVNQLGYAGTTENYNVLTFEVNTDSVGSFNERNAGAAIYNYGTNANLFFEVMPERSEARIRLLSGNSTIFGVRATHAAINNHDWITVKCVFENEYVAMFINGDLVLSYFGIEDCQFSDTLCMMSAWDTAASFRNMVFSAEEYSLAELGYTDLDFLDEKGVDAVSAENATVAYDRENQEVDVTVQAENPVVSFVVNQTVGGLYSAYLPIRNTILIRMANGTIAEQLKFYLLTSESDEWYEKTIEILPNSGYTTYYVNVSDLGVDGYLRGMKFEFVGVNSGTISIDAISFEREDAIYEFAAENFSLLANKETGTVTFSGKLLSKYAGKEIKLIEMDNSNYQELLSYFPQKLIATGTADNNGNFTITFPLKQEGSEMTHLSTIFLASVDGVKLANSFQIENYRDFINNPYAFELPELTVSVMDAQFGAVGDGFTNDNAAIQAAIDYVAAQGGGVVVLPGDTANDYGRRYIATNLEMRSNVELRIEKGAVLWQSPRIADYNYDVIIGHDYETNVMWPHACNVNRPLILLRGVENVRVTGGGTIRMLDWGAEEKDPMKLIDPSHSVSCGNIIHIAPIFSVSSTNVEFSDLKILRTNNWNLTTLYTKNLFVANVHFGEVNCKNGDGIGLCNIDGAYIVRCRLFGTDDAFTLNGSHNDPRWFISDWGAPINPVHKGAQNIEIAHCNMRGGLGLVFIPWGTNAEDLSTSEIKNVVVYDSIITGFGQDIGGWVDDPFYGWSSNENFLLANGEFDDYAPIKDVYMYNNKYKFDKAIITQLGNSVVADSANFITDSVLKCTSQFVNSSFERNLRYDGEETWVSGLSYWSSIVNENGEVGYEARGEKEATAKYSQVDYTVTDYAGFASNGKLYQGLYLERGIYAMTATVKNVAGTAELFVGKSLLKQHIWDETAVEVLSTQAVPVSDEYAEVTFTFTVKTAGVYAVGLTHSGTVGEKAYLDDVSIEQTGTVEDEEAAFEKAKADTQNYLELAKSHDKNLYTAESYAALATAMQNAEEALANADTDRATYEACANGLLEAMKALVEIDFAAENKAVLETTVATAKTYTADKYTEESFAALQTAIANAEAAIANGATAEEYESLNTALTSAIDGLTEKPDDKPATGCGAVAFSSTAVALLALGATLTVFVRKRKD